MPINRTALTEVLALFFGGVLLSIAAPALHMIWLSMDAAAPAPPSCSTLMPAAPAPLSATADTDAPLVVLGSLYICRTICTILFVLFSQLSIAVYTPRGREGI
jgi:hypothetical protein